MLKNLEKHPKNERGIIEQIHASSAESNLLFSFGFIRILALLIVAFSAYAGVILGTIHFVNNLIETIVQVNLKQFEKNNLSVENGMGLDNATAFVHQLSSEFLHYIGILFVLSLITLFVFHLINQIKFSKKA